MHTGGAKLVVVVAVLALVCTLAQKGFAGQTMAPKFSHPREITNPYLPLASLKQDILEGKEGGDVALKSHTAR